MKKIPVILDGDPGHDDAIAWMLAGAIPEFDILAVCSVAGNQTIEKTTYNARRICALLKIEAPIAKGAAKPILSDPFTAGNWHGESGLDGPKMPEPDRELCMLSAPALMKKVIEQSEEPVVIIATGPLTNVAELLLCHPEVKDKIAKISIMGGGLQYGNWTPAAEFNILEDPEAADIVFRSGIFLQMCGLDVTEKAIITPEDIHTIREQGNQVSEITASWIEFFICHPMELGYAGAPVHDPCAVLSLVHPEMFEFKDYAVEIELDGEYTRGETVCDFNGCLQNKENVHCVMNIDRSKYVEMICQYLHAYDGKEVQI